jgi:hypothetical protein
MSLAFRAISADFGPQHAVSGYRGLRLDRLVIKALHLLSQTTEQEYAAQA